MSAKNGDKSRHHVNRKRAVERRAKTRAFLAAKAAAPTSPAPARKPPAKAAAE